MQVLVLIKFFFAALDDFIFTVLRFLLDPTAPAYIMECINQSASMFVIEVEVEFSLLNGFYGINHIHVSIYNY